tara:strand:- start:2218 stop:3510 length:1293 start_codon:yes stop_codon:yes gene_type:complete
MAKHDERSPLELLAIPLLLLFIFGASWYLYGTTVLAISFKLSIVPFTWFSSIPEFMLPEGAPTEYLLVAKEMKTASPSNFGWETFEQILGLWGYVIRIVLVPALLIVAGINFKLPINYYYRRSLNLRQLAEQNAELFPCTKPSLGKDLHRQNPYDGPWRIADDYIDFASFNGLLLYKGRPIENTKVKDRSLSIKKKRKLFPHHNYVTLDKEKTDQLFINQLGRPWRGVGGLDSLERALVTALMALTAGGEYRQRGRDLLDQISRTYIEGSAGIPHKADLTGVSDLLGEVEHHEYVRDVVEKHGYESTVFIALLVSAREKAGKVPPSSFLWLRPTNRTLWYTLHPIGGRKPWVEGAAGWCHYFAEKELEKSIGTPIVQGATDSLESELYNEKWVYAKGLADAEAVELEEERRMLEEAEKARTFSQAGKGRR